MTLPEDNTRLFHSVPSFPHLLALGRICHLFTKGAPKGTGACWQLEAFLGRDGPWAAKNSVAVLVFVLP